MTVHNDIGLESEIALTLIMQDIVMLITAHATRRPVATLLIIGLSSSLSIGSEVLCTQQFVQRWRRRTNDDLQFGYINQRHGCSHNLANSRCLNTGNMYDTWYTIKNHRHILARQNSYREKLVRTLCLDQRTAKTYFVKWWEHCQTNTTVDVARTQRRGNQTTPGKEIWR